MANKVPEIRFAEFEGEWETFEFTDMVQRVGHMKKDESLPCVEFEDINAKRGTLNKNIFDKKTHKSGLEFNVSDILYGKLRPYLGNVLLSNFHGLAVGDFWIFRTSEISPSYLYHFLLGPSFGKVANISQGSKMPRASWENIKESKFAFPELKESKTIAKFLSDIDYYITKQEDLVSQYIITKQALLNALFPQDKEKQPRIRINGHSGDWVEKQLGDIVSAYRDVVDTPHDGYERLGIRSFGKGTFHSFVPKGSELETARMNVVRANNLIVSITFGWELAVAITESQDEGKLVSHRFPQFVFNEGNIPLFYRYRLINDRFRKHLILASPGSAGRNRVLKIDKMLEYKILVPSQKEQKAIADLLTEYDRLIRLNEQKLDMLQNLKQAMLDKMFV